MYSISISKMKAILLFFLFIVFPICGIQALMKGEIGTGLFFLSPLMLALCGLAYQLFYKKPLEKRQETLRKKYNLPNVIRDEYGDKWDREFQKVIAKAIESASDNEKRTDLLQCQKVAEEMMKDSSRNTFNRPYYMINKAFRLTGCHLTITDSQGRKISQIV